MSGALDEDTRQSLNEGRETLGAMLSAAQSDLQRVFIVAVLGLVGTIWALREFVWARMRTDLFARMDAETQDAVEVIAVTPFDVILLQVKIGLIVGLVLAVPMILWYSRDALRERGYWPGDRIPRWKLWSLVGLAVVLLVAGISYAYFLFFPLMFEFLATNAVNVGLAPTYSIVDWFEFILLLTVSFALAAQLPLVMSALTYANIVQYETFRDKWRWAVVGIFAFGALFSPPDPFTQIMWAVPLILLYAFSLKLAQVVTMAKRSGAKVDVPGVVRGSWNVLAGSGFLAAVAVYGFFTRGGVQAVNRALQYIPAGYRPRPRSELGEALGIPNEVAAGLVAVVVAVVVVAATALFLLSRALRAADEGADHVPYTRAESAEDVDFEALSAGQVRRVPLEAFADLSEGEATAKASAAMDADDPEKAQAILDRYDEAAEADLGDEDAEAPAGEESDTPAESASSTTTETAAGMVDAFTEDETTEEDIGGYYYDLTFIIESLTSKAFYLVGLFMVVLAGTFVALYMGLLREFRDMFLARMPPALAEQVEIVTLHPVEALMFMIKFSTALAVVATLPLTMYFAWPALKERSWVTGDRRLLLVWGGSLLVGIVGGSVLGFVYIAPTAISWLATDAIQSNMVIAYRINNFGWLVVYLTVGVGILALIPVTMVLFHVGNIVTYDGFRAYWRHVVVGLFAAAAVLSPRGMFTMLFIAIPAAAVFLLGLALLWVVTLGGRAGPPEPRQAGAD